MCKIRARWRMPMATQRAPWGGKSSTRESAVQVVVWMVVTAGEMRTGEPENGLDSSRRHSLRHQVAGDPQIDDAPIGLRKAVGDPPALQTTAVDGDGLGRSNVWKTSTVQGRRGNRGAGMGSRLWRRDGLGRLQQGLGLWCQAGTGVHQSDPGSLSARYTPRRFLIGEPRQSSQMTPVDARRITVVSLCQPLARSGRHGWFQRSGAETDPSLQVARTGLHHYARRMPMGAHRQQHLRLRGVEVDQNITGVSHPRGRSKYRSPRGCGRGETAG